MVLFAGVGLLFTARYPRGLYDFAMGLNRWVMRVVAYAALMTDEYPPFRLDQGGADPAQPIGPTPSGLGGAAQYARGTAPAGPGVPAGPGASGGGRAGAVVALVAGLLVGLVGLGLASVGAGGLWLQSRRDAAGFVSTNTQLLSSTTAAITAEDVDLRIGDGVEGWVSSDRFGTIRVRATAVDGSPVFIGIAPESAIDTWLAPVAHDELRTVTGDRATYLRQDGGAAAAAPTSQTFWSASVSGTGTQELQWQIRSGRWGLVLARPDGAPGLEARVDVGARIPGITGLATGLLIGGLVLLAGGTVLVVVGAIRLSAPAPGGGGRTAPRPGGPPAPPAQPVQQAQPAPPAPPAPRPAAADEHRPAAGTSAATPTGTDETP
jgi:hypothetical protein